MVYDIISDNLISEEAGGDSSYRNRLIDILCTYLAICNGSNL